MKTRSKLTSIFLASQKLTTILLFIGGIFLFRSTVIENYYIPSESMENTLLVGDRLLANRFIYGSSIPFTSLRTPAYRAPARGEIVVAKPSSIPIVKRVLGLPQDTLEMRHRELFINGKHILEEYITPSSTPDSQLPREGLGSYEWHFDVLLPGTDWATYSPTRDNWGPIVVPEGKYFLLGDNRDYSFDSRYIGFVRQDQIVGKILFVYYSKRSSVR